VKKSELDVKGGKVVILVYLVPFFVLAPFSIVGLTYLIKRFRAKRSIERGLVKILIIRKNGLVSEHYLEPDSGYVKLKNGRYLLATTAELVLMKEGEGKIRDVFEHYFTADGMRVFIFDEEDALPVNISKRDKLMNPKYLEQTIKIAASMERSHFDRYYGVAVASLLTVIALLVFFLSMGGIT